MVLRHRWDRQDQQDAASVHSVHVAQATRRPVAHATVACAASVGQLRKRLKQVRARTARRRGGAGAVVVDADHIAPPPSHVARAYTRAPARDVRIARAHTRREKTDDERQREDSPPSGQTLFSPREASSSSSSVLSTRAHASALYDDLLSGLRALGYRAADAKPVARQIAASAPPDATIEQALKLALKQLSKFK